MTQLIKSPLLDINPASFARSIPVTEELEMSTFFEALGRLVVRFRYPIIAAWIIAAVLSVVALPSLSSVVKTTQSDFLPSNSPSLKAEKRALHFNHQNSALAQMTLVAVTTNPALTPAQDSAITAPCSIPCLVRPGH